LLDRVAHPDGEEGRGREFGRHLADAPGDSGLELGDVELSADERFDVELELLRKRSLGGGRGAAEALLAEADEEEDPATCEGAGEEVHEGVGIHDDGSKE